MTGRGKKYDESELRDGMEFKSTLAKHINQQDISVKEYLQSLSLELYRDLTNKKIVYLDTKFWLIFRDVKLGRNQNRGAQTLFQLVCQLKKDGRCNFPISEDVFLEVMKQSDISTLSATAKLIDQLSDGRSLISLRERIGLEALHFVMQTTGMNVHPLEALVWTKIAYTMGFISPQTNLDPATDSAIQKAFIDQMWGASLKDMVEQIGIDEEAMKLLYIDIADAQNEGKFKYADENHSYSQMFLSELAGFLEVCEDQLGSVMLKLRELKTGVPTDQKEIDRGESAQSMSKMIYNLFRLDKISTELPTFRIMAGLDIPENQGGTGLGQKSEIRKQRLS
jgi:hypothetical protein